MENKKVVGWVLTLFSFYYNQLIRSFSFFFNIFFLVLLALHTNIAETTSSELCVDVLYRKCPGSLFHTPVGGKFFFFLDIEMRIVTARNFSRNRLSFSLRLGVGMPFLFCPPPSLTVSLSFIYLIS